MAKRKVTNYSEEFRKSSAKLAVDSRQALSTTAEELGVHVTTLHGWVKKYHPSSLQAKPASTNDAILEELAHLRKENMRLKQERDILKKAAAYFASEAK
jgi:transposase